MSTRARLNPHKETLLTERRATKSRIVVADMPATFEPRLDILPESQRRLWSELDAVPSDFVLYGGTALALQLGHRVSEDFDFFSSQSFEPDRLRSRLRFFRDLGKTFGGTPERIRTSDLLLRREMPLRTYGLCLHCPCRESVGLANLRPTRFDGPARGHNRVEVECL